MLLTSVRKILLLIEPISRRLDFMEMLKTRQGPVPSLCNLTMGYELPSCFICLVDHDVLDYVCTIPAS